MAERVSQAPLEILVQPDTTATRVSQAVLEVLVLPDSPATRVSQAVVEVAVEPPPATAYLYQAPAEVLYQPDDAAARIYQAPAEVLYLPDDTSVRLYQAPVEVLVRFEPGGSFPADALIRTSGGGSLSSDAVIGAAGSGSFPADATVFRTIAGTFPSDAWISQGEIIGSFAADAVIDLYWGPWTPPESNPVVSEITLDAWFVAATTGAVTADAVVRRTASGTLTADATMGRTISGSFSAQARLGGRFTADAALVGEYVRVEGSFTADATIRRTGITGSVTAKATIYGTVSRSFAARAIIRGPVEGSFPAWSWFTSGGSFTASSWVSGTITRTFTAQAILSIARAGSFTADARFAQTFTADAQLYRQTARTFYAKAYLWNRQYGSLTAAAYLSRRLTADATIYGAVARSVTADAEISSMARVNGSFSASATVFGGVARSFTQDAAIQATASTGSITADAWINFYLTANAAFRVPATSGSFTARAWIYAPAGSPVPTPFVSIRVNDVEIAQDVIFSECQFTMNVNGAPGSFKLVVRDVGHDWAYDTGAEVTVDVDGKRKFGGYVTMVTRTYAFPVDDTSDVSQTARLYTLSGADYNILFNTRILYKKSEPRDVGLREWAAGTEDDNIIRYIFNNYTDLPADNATYQNVTHVGHPNPDRNGVVGSGGLTFGDAMREVNRLISAVWYFDPYKDLNYVDVDIPDAAYGLSDNPGPGQVGYRELEHMEDGANLANDALVWGTGKGSDDLTFARSTDAASITTHGRWQFGEYTSQLYKQASVNLRASTIVNGTPQSKRGGKNDKESWLVTTYEPSFAVGQKVAIESEVFGLSGVFPIRKLTMTFPTKTTLQYQLVLSHEIDTPWNMYEFYFPRFNFDYRVPRIDTDIDTCPPVPGGDCVCGITDTFTRTVTTGWGTSDSGMVWQTLTGSPTVNGSQGVLPNGAHVYFLVSLPSTSSVFDFQLTENGFLAYFPSSNSSILFKDQTSEVLVTRTISEVSETASFSFSAGVNYRARVVDDDTKTQVKVWLASASEPASWLVENIIDDSGFTSPGPGFLSAGTSLVDNLDIDGVDACEYMWDSFTRTVSPGWGIPDNGEPWQYANASGTALFGVDGNLGYFQSSSTSERNAYWNWDESVSAPWWVWGPNWSTVTKRACTMYMRFRIASFPSSGYLLVMPEPGGSYQFNILVNSDGSGGYGYNPSDVSMNWISDTWYIAEWRHGAWTLGGQYEVNQAWSIYKEGEQSGTWLLYPEGTTEGAWRYQGSTGNSIFDVAFISAVTSGTGRVEFDYIDFDYDGKPCTGNIFPVAIDNWDNRTIALGAGSGTVWGVASGGVTWHNPTTEQQGEYAVADGVGRIRVTNPSSGASAGFVTMNSGGSDYAPWAVTGSGFPDGLVTGTAMTIAMDFMVDIWGTNTYVEFWVTDNVATDVGGVMVSFLGGSSVTDTFRLDTYDATSTSSTALTFQNGTWYTFKMFVSEHTVSAKLWQRGSAEPAWQLYRYTEQLPWTPGSIDLLAQTYTVGGAGYTNFYFDNLVQYTSVPTASGSTVDCDDTNNSTATAGQTTFQMPVQILPGSSRVWVNGYFKRPGYDYVEYPELGRIVFNDPLSGGEFIHIEYRAFGSL